MLAPIKTMRPPATRNFVGKAEQHRPKVSFGVGPSGRLTANKAENGNYNLMNSASVIPHEKIAMPLVETNHYRNLTRHGDLSRNPIRVTLPKRPNLNAPDRKSVV